MVETLDIFYKRESPVRRFRLLCDNLSLFLIDVFSGALKMTANLVNRLGKSQAILALSDSHLWDHICHSGNVFWIGYYLLNTITRYREPRKLEGFKAEIFAANNKLGYFDQLNLSWMIASLFHDIGYADEKHNDLMSILKAVFPGNNLQISKKLDPAAVKKATKPLTESLKKVTGANSNVYKAFKYMWDYYGNDVAKKTKGKKNDKDTIIVADHGILSAARLMEWKEESNIPKIMEPVISHSAIAMALHNLVKWQETYSDVPDKCQLKLGTLPVCNLLAFCDTFQAWDRELVMDYAQNDEESDLGERISKARRAEIQGSRIAKFSLSDKICGTDVRQLSARIRYYMRPGTQAKAVADGYLAKIKKWRTEEWTEQLRTVFSLDQLIRARIEYHIPMANDTVNIEI